MINDKGPTEALDDAALEDVAGGAKHASGDLAAPMIEEGEIAAAPAGTPWAKQLRKLKKTIK